MFGGIGGLGQLAGLLGKLPKIQEEAEKLRERIDRLTAEGHAGGGMVTVKVTGRMTVTSCRISTEALADREMLEDLVAAATTQALDRVKDQISEETRRMATEVGLPPGVNLPGLM
ncbi:MAG: YbaB/EbfC family nucleoid-associated protein [Gemmataceae bacterium]